VRIVHADFGADVAVETTRLVASAVAPLHAEPRASSEQVTQSLAGHLVVILEVREGWKRVRLDDGYEGWMHEGYLDARALGADAVREWRGSARYSLGCTIRDAVSGVERTMPFGARVARDAAVVAGEALDEAERGRRFPPDGGAISSSAVRWFTGTSYQWGGITPWGADCSGIVQAVFGLHGVQLPRDARQQAALGAPLALTPDAWRVGDLLFFSDRADGRITHVALVADAETLMHVAIGRGGFGVERPSESRDPYTVALMGRLRGARRLFSR
jgi:cell wall-associated NlpC family hydrolase